MRFFVGTSGYSYKEWTGSFYPEKLPQKKMVLHYAQRFAAVEINNTFHRFPTEETVRAWAKQVPESFRFVLKAQQIITHFRGLQNAERHTDDFIRIVSVLKKRQGPILFQLPPNFNNDLPRLEAFLKYVDGRARIVFEFRHESWFCDDTYDCLQSHLTARCVTDEVDLPQAKFVRTVDFGYVRLREERYTTKALNEWIQRIRTQKWPTVYVFFKHEDVGAGPALVPRFLELAQK